jgi:hypothetical protein
MVGFGFPWIGGVVDWLGGPGEVIGGQEDRETVPQNASRKGLLTQALRLSRAQLRIIAFHDFPIRAFCGHDWVAGHPGELRCASGATAAGDRIAAAPIYTKVVADQFLSADARPRR